ncbi:MAG: glycosyltransferase family 2 protein [Bacteroidales bacterium]|nr:glycosyltransferase family 2 protein [Bacteroidales bacterium]
MATRPSISVVVPIYGVEPYITRFAESLLGQTYDKVQFVFVNDGTKDASIEVLSSLIDERFAHLKDRIIIVNKVNQGLPAARKTGMEYAEGDYVLHVDSDDWLECTLLEKLAIKIEETGSDIVYFDFYKEYASYAKHDVEKDYTAQTKMKFIHGLFNYKAYGYVWNKCVRRQLYLDNDVFFPSYGMHEDIYLMSQLIYHADSITHLNEPLYHYRRDNPGSISASKRKNRRRDSAMNMMDLYEHFKDDVMNSPVRDVVGEIMFRTAWLSLRYDLGFFRKYPYLPEMIRKMRPSFSNKTFIIWQCFVKLYVACKFRQ